MKCTVANVANNPMMYQRTNQFQWHSQLALETVVLPDVVLEVARLCSIAASEKVHQW